MFPADNEAVTRSRGTLLIVSPGVASDEAPLLDGRS